MAKNNLGEIINRIGVEVFKGQIAEQKERLHVKFVQQENKQLVGSQAEQLAQYQRQIKSDSVCLLMAAYCEMEPVINSGAISFENWVQQSVDFLLEMKENGQNELQIPQQALQNGDWKPCGRVEVVVYNHGAKNYTDNLVPDEKENHERTKEDREFNCTTLLIGLSGLLKQMHEDNIRSFDSSIDEMKNFYTAYRNNMLTTSATIKIVQ